MIKAENGLGNNNFCRAPDDSFDKPWCFTMDTNPEKEKEACRSEEHTSELQSP